MYIFFSETMKVFRAVYFLNLITAFLIKLIFLFQTSPSEINFSSTVSYMSFFFIIIIFSFVIKIDLLLDMIKESQDVSCH